MPRKSTEEKIRYLHALMRERPRITIEQLRKAIHAKFGTTLNTPALNAAVKAYRQGTELPPEEPEPHRPNGGHSAGGQPPAAELPLSLAAIKRSMIALGISCVRLLRDGTLQLEMSPVSEPEELSS